MLNDSQLNKLRLLVNKSLDIAETHWAKGGSRLVNEMAILKSRDFSEPSEIPGHETVQEEETVIDTFIAFVADLRDSSKHLLCASSPKKTRVSGLQRVYYETSALLPAIGYVVQENGGKVTEYLGDGALALFQVKEYNKSEAITASYWAAKELMGCGRNLVNEILKKRYALEPLNIGIGLSLSPALVTLVGIPPKKHPKAIGECIYRATKLSGGNNEIVTDSNLQAAWPTTKNGTLEFHKKTVRGELGYVIDRMRK